MATGKELMERWSNRFRRKEEELEAAKSVNQEVRKELREAYSTETQAVSDLVGVVSAVAAARLIDAGVGAVEQLKPYQAGSRALAPAAIGGGLWFAQLAVGQRGTPDSIRQGLRTGTAGLTAIGLERVVTWALAKWSKPALPAAK